MRYSVSTFTKSLASLTTRPKGLIKTIASLDVLSVSASSLAHALRSLQKSLIYVTSHSSKVPRITLLRHFLIVSSWKSWLFPAVCLVPYFLIVFWMFSSGLAWVAQVMLAPILMAVIIGLMTLWLAVLEFRDRLPKS